MTDPNAFRQSPFQSLPAGQPSLLGKLMAFVVGTLLLIAGFMFAAVAKLVALASGAFPTHPTSVGYEAIEGLIIYAQLSVVCLSVYFVRRRKKV